MAGAMTGALEGAMAGVMNQGDTCFTLKNGVTMPAVGLGTMGMRHYQPLFNTVDAALNSGYRLFDTSAIFGNEKLLRNIFRQLLPKYNLTRHDIFISTKMVPVSNDPKFAVRAVERSLKNLDMDYIDLFLLQYPSPPNGDQQSPHNAKMRAETWRALIKLLHKSKVKAIGVANFNIRHLIQLTDEMPVAPMINQIEWHPYYYQPEMLQYCNENNIRIQAYSSFGGLSQNNAVLINDPIVNDVARRYNVSPAQVLLVWALQKGVAVIPKSSNPNHIKENMTLNFIIGEKDMVMLDSLGAKNKKYAWDPSSVA